MRVRGGFTLIELIVVTTLGMMLLAIAIPRLDMQGLRVNATEREVAMMLLAAQQRAVLQQHPVNVLFDTASSLVVVHEDRDGDRVREPGEPERVYVLEDGVRFTAAGVPRGPVGDSTIAFQGRVGVLPAVTFQRSGAAREAGGLYLGTQRSAGGTHPADARALELERATGRITRYYLEGTSWRRVSVQ